MVAVVGERRESQQQLGVLPVRSRWAKVNKSMLGLAILLMALGAFGAVVLSSSGSTAEVVVVARPVAAGTVLTRADLGTAELSATSGQIQAVPALQLESLVGKRAAWPLVQGMVLAPGAVSSGPAVAAGAAWVPLAIGAGNVPPGLASPGPSRRPRRPSLRVVLW
jgi:flagella basal body P-ring formation protein FlgA